MKPTYIALLALCLCLPLVGAFKKPLTKEGLAKVIQAAIRKKIKKPTGELTKADLEKVRLLIIAARQLTDVKSLEKLTQLRKLDIYNNLLTKAQIAELQKALPKYRITHNAKKQPSSP